MDASTLVVSPFLVLSGDSQRAGQLLIGLVGFWVVSSWPLTVPLLQEVSC